MASLRAEVLKLRTTRTFVTFVAVAIATSVLIAGLVASLGDRRTLDVLTDVYASDTSSFFILLLAIVGITGEWRHRTITSTLLAAPDRVRFLGAKTVAYAGAGVVLSLAIAVATGIVATIALGVRSIGLPDLDDLLVQVGRNLYVAGLLGALGVVFGALVRNQVAAVVGVLVVVFLVEPLALGLVPEVGRWSPFGALPVAAAGLQDSGFGSDDLPGVLPATLALAAWIGGLLFVGAVMLRQRDVE
jgi:hypothetical protein